MAPDGSITQARALLIARQRHRSLRNVWPKGYSSRRSSNFTIKGVAGYDIRPRGTVSFKVAGVRGGGKQIEVEASVLPKVTADLPTIPVSPVAQWKHLSGLELADPDYGTPA